MYGTKLAQSIAKLEGIKINTRELIDEWLLITYDIPVTEDGNEARLRFLQAAPKIGAMMHSRSVYLMPNTQEAQKAAVELSKTVGGEVYIWTSKVGEDQAKQITEFYDRKIQDEIAVLNDRLLKEAINEKDGKYGMADRMHKKSANLFNQLIFTVMQRGANEKVINQLRAIEKTLNEVRK